MSHFTVAVITEDGDYESALEPFYEQGEADDYFMVFEDLTEEMEQEWNENKTEEYAVNTVTSERVNVYNHSKYRESNRSDAPIKEDWEIVGIPIQEVYMDIDHYVEKYHGYHKNEDGRYGYYYNPDAKWDWYSLGGRWRGMLLIKADLFDSEGMMLGIPGVFDNEAPAAPEGYMWVDHAMIKDVEWEKMKELSIAKLLPYEDYLNKNTFYKKEYMEKMYPDEETYINRMTSFSTFAVLNEEGWHEKGQMGWFGMSSEGPEEAIDWDLAMFERYIKTANPESFISIVDCHI